MARRILLALIMLMSSAPTIAADDLPLRHWGFGWDPGESGQGLTMRYRFTPVWDLSLAAGPNDYRSDGEARSWDDDDDILDDGATAWDDARREEGWVRLATGARIWRQDRFAVSAACGLTYRWSNGARQGRSYRSYSDELWDYYNTRAQDDFETWTVTLGLRPSWDVTTRMRIEFEAGLAFDRTTAERVSETWWDSFPPTTREEATSHDRSFRSFGTFDLWRLKFIFWI